MTLIPFTAKPRRVVTLAYLRRTGQCELLVRQGSQTIERRYFDAHRCPCGEYMDHGELLCPSCEVRR